MRVWLCQIAKNCYLDHCRREKKRPDGAQDEVQFVPEPGAGPDELIEWQEDARQIHRHLHEMAEPYKEVFMLRVFGEMSFGEIGALFGRSANWACVVYHRARAKIRRKMEGEG